MSMAYLSIYLYLQFLSSGTSLVAQGLRIRFHVKNRLLDSVGGERENLREQHWNIHITMCKADSQRKLDIWRRAPKASAVTAWRDGVGREAEGRSGCRWHMHICGQFMFSSVAQSCLFATPWTAACQVSLSITNSGSLLKTHVHRVSDAIHLILCRPLLLPPSIFPSIRGFANESVLPIRWKLRVLTIGLTGIPSKPTSSSSDSTALMQMETLCLLCYLCPGQGWDLKVSYSGLAKGWGAKSRSASPSPVGSQQLPPITGMSSINICWGPHWAEHWGILEA